MMEKEFSDLSAKLDRIIDNTAAAANNSAAVTERLDALIRFFEEEEPPRQEPTTPMNPAADAAVSVATTSVQQPEG